MARSRDEVVEEARNRLVKGGIQKDSAIYLSELYADSPQGQEHQKSKPDDLVVAASCVIGIVPLF